MRAALSARTDPDLVIAARTSAAIITDARDAATRMQAYEEAGVDTLFLYGINDLAGLETIARATTLPLILGSAPRPVKEPAVLAANRVRICLQGHQPLAAAIQAIYETLRRLKAGEDPERLPNLAPPSLMEAVSRTGDYERWAALWMRTNSESASRCAPRTRSKRGPAVPAAGARQGRVPARSSPG